MPNAVVARCARSLAGLLVIALAGVSSADRGGPPAPPVGPAPSPAPPAVGGSDIDTDRPEREPSSAGTPSTSPLGADPEERGSTHPFASWRSWWGHWQRGLPAQLDVAVDPVSDALLAERIPDRLLEIVHEWGADHAVRATAITALARMGDDRDATRRVLYAPLAEADPAPHRTEVVAAAFAAVRLGDHRPATRALLLRCVAGHRTDGSRAPAYAALALGLLGDTDGGAVTDVLLLTATSPTARPAIRAAAALALGLLGDATALGPLAAVTGSGEADDDELCARIDALGRLMEANADTTYVAVLQSLLADAGTGRSRGSAALALARVLPSLDATSRRRVGTQLRDVASRDESAAARRAALLALGRAAASVRDDAVTRRRLRSALEHGLRRMRDDTQIRCFAAFGLSLAAAGPDRDAALATLREVARRTNAGELRGAVAVARGAAGDERIAPQPDEKVSAPGTPPTLRADRVTALGLLGDPAHREPVLFELLHASDRDVRRAAAVACGRLGDAAAASALLAPIARASRRFDARSLARVAGDQAVRRLLDLVGDENELRLPTATRAMTTLGHVRRRGHDPVDRLADVAAAGAAIPAVLDALAQP